MTDMQQAIALGFLIRHPYQRVLLEREIVVQLVTDKMPTDLGWRNQK
jgi:hypothetical protein